ncbi:hypothetical protein QFC21_000040 [Naganishia friedmannii]|uniref:Uncharacterized protein n=1 Tax=Naganishia friedmannii TaxID=89922 RepID=A0ACC2WC67_9TREE|nr:hypothetical protein QFC21_000040 [Naganishia friedmannii]
MWLKSRKERERLALAISMAEQRRKQEADRIMRLAEAAPEKLTRAERAAVEGKAAWRESVSTWRQSVTTAERDVDSMVGARPNGRESGSMASNGARISRESSKVYFTTTRPRYSRASTTSPTPASFEKPVQEITEERNNALEKLMGRAKPAANQYTAVPMSTSPVIPPDAKRIDYLARLAHSQIPASTPGSSDIRQPVSQVQPSSIVRPSRIADMGNTERVPETLVVHALPSVPPIHEPMPTTMYGFHLPHPQAGKAYTMAALANPTTGSRGHAFVPMNDRHTIDGHTAEFRPTTSNAATHQVPKNLSIGSMDISQPLGEVPTADAHRSNGRGRTTVHRDLLPRPHTNVLGPRPRSQPVLRPRSLSNPSLTRRPAQLRRPSAEVTDSPRCTSSSGPRERPKSGGSSLSSRPSLSSEEVGEFAKRGSQVGPEWHRKRMEKLHESVSSDDLTGLPK